VIQDFPNDVCASDASEEPVDVEQSNVDMDIVWEERGAHFRPIPYPLAIKTVAAAFEFQAQRDQGHSAIPRVGVTRHSIRDMRSWFSSSPNDGHAIRDINDGTWASMINGS
jgi:hypothetical protein